MKDYKYIYHWSPYRPKEKAWACIHRDDEIYYWNGKGPNKDGEIYKKRLRIFYAESPLKAWDKKEMFDEVHKTI